MIETPPNGPDIRQNAGRCDICGKQIEMEEGDQLSISEFGVPDDVTEEHGVTDQDAAESIADTLESVGDSPEDHELAETIRNELAFKVHEECINKTAYDKLTVPAEEMDDE